MAKNETSNYPFVFYFQVAKSGVTKKTLVLLHGTGADERDLLPLVEPFSADWNILSLRGNVMEQGMLRFFKRVSPGVFDQENIREETVKLTQFLSMWQEEHQVNSEDFLFLGFSNGANMILAELFLYPEFIHYAVALHPMLPFEPASDLDLSHTKMLITFGENDPMVSVAEVKKLISLLSNKKASLTVFSHSSGHQLSNDEVAGIHTFISKV